MSAQNREKFGTGYLTEAEQKDEFVLSDAFIHFDKNGAGGAVPVQGYSGLWPLFGKPRERLGGPDVLAVPDEGSSASSSSAGQASGGSSSVDRARPVRFVKRPKWMCRPKSGCVPCDRKELHRPYCQPYGNHVVIECRRIEVTKPPERKPKAQEGKADDGKKKNANGKAAEPKAGAGAGKRRRAGQQEEGWIEIPLSERDMGESQEMFVGGHVYKGHQICGRDRNKEAIDYAEFTVVNLLLALLGLYVLLRRQRVLAGQHQSMLARRIGRM